MKIFQLSFRNESAGWLGRMWIVAISEPRYESRAAENISRQGCETYTPRLRESLLIEGRRVFREVLMFPRYLFVCIDGPWRFLLNTIGIMNVIRGGGSDSPAHLDDSVIKYFRKQEGSDGIIQLSDQPLFRYGQRVRFNNGCFSGLVGLYQGASSLERERVLLNMLGRPTPVSASAGSLVAA